MKNNLNVANKYNKIAHKYQKAMWHHGPIQRAMSICDLLTKEAKVLDIGIGIGKMEEPLCRGVELYGIDISWKMLHEAQKILPKEIIRRLICADAENLPYNSERFEIVIASEVIYYLQHPITLFHEAHRVLKPGGKFIIITLTPLWLKLTAISSKILNWPLDRWDVRPIGITKIKKFFRECSFIDINSNRKITSSFKLFSSLHYFRISDVVWAIKPT